MPESDAANSKALRGRSVAALAILLVGGLAIHLRSLASGFFADDYLFLEQVRGRSLFAALSSPDPLGNFIRPLGRQAWFWFVSRVWREAPFPFHVANLLVFLGSVALLYRLVRRMGGDAPTAVTASAFLAFHYAADVPVQWAAGAQDLLALLFAMAAIYGHVCGKRALSAAGIIVALLAKESVALACLVAIVATRDPKEPWSASIRRAGFMLAATAGWAVWWLATARASHVHSPLSVVQFGSLPAAVAHFVQSALGLEFRAAGSPLGHWRPSALWPGLVAAAALWLSSSGSASDHEGAEQGNPRDRLIRTGAVWCLAGVLPVVPVAGIWSAYFYVFAVAGAAILVAATTSSLSKWPRLAAVGMLVYLSANARLLDEFSSANGVWAWQSHVNLRYLDRAVSTIQGYLGDMKRSRPALPPRSVVFFADVPVSLGWQAADGPLIRWAYRDTTLRSYYLTQFSEERARLRPVYFFAVEQGHLVDKSESADVLPAFAYSMLLADKPTSAIAALNMLLSRPGRSIEWSYWRALARWDTGDTVGAAQDLIAAGMRPVRRARNASSQSLPADTLARYASLIRLRAEAAVDPWAHARLASLCLAKAERQQEGVIEAYAFRVLSPKDPDAWRKWASAQLTAKQYAPALHSLEEYAALAGEAGKADAEAEDVIRSLRRVLYGDVAHTTLRAPPTSESH